MNAPTRADDCEKSSEVISVDPMADHRSTTDALRRALAGDRDAWALIIDEYSKLLWWIARSYRLDDATAADVVQTVWLQLVGFGHRITNPDALPGWLATTARREAMRRSSGRDIATANVPDADDRLLPDSDERLIDEEMTGIALAAFERLSPDDQKLLRLVCAVPPMSYAEIAALLGKTHGHIGPMRQRALDRLRVLVREMGLS